MKHCYNSTILWVSVFALLILIVSTLHPYKNTNKNGERFAATELDGEDLNNHSCPKLMKNSVYFKDHYDTFNKDQKSIVSFMEPGLSEEYMETESKRYLKGMCIIPDDKMNSYNLKLEEDPVKGSPSQICKASFKNKKDNSTTDVVLPYVKDVNSGCALVFSEYGKEPNKIKEVLNNLNTLSNEYNEQLRQKNLDQKTNKQNEYNTFNSADKQLNRRRRNYDNQNTKLTSNVSQVQSALDMTKAENNQVTQQNKHLKNKLTSTW
jgi:hypothetical protein